MSTSVLDLEKAYFTSRGIGVIDVNYGGSTGYGRAYRERLRAPVGSRRRRGRDRRRAALVRSGEADGARLAIRGGSAGGWTTLAAVTQTSLFKAATSYFGISRPREFARDTHDFESQYLFGLIGPLPGFEMAYQERSPIKHAPARPPVPFCCSRASTIRSCRQAQSERFAKALGEQNIQYAYLTFEGEAHGFRRAETNIACLEAELSFYGQTLGFKPKDIPTLDLD